MTAFIPQISSHPILKALGTNNLFRSVIYRLKEMNESLSKLTYIAKLPLSNHIKKECIKHIKRQYKLIEIAQDLQERLLSLRLMNAQELKVAYQKKSLQQTIQEVDLLFEMHFQVKSSYFTFLNRYYKKPLSQSKPSMVA
jgi:hypothetical protein